MNVTMIDTIHINHKIQEDFFILYIILVSTLCAFSSTLCVMKLLPKRKKKLSVYLALRQTEIEKYSSMESIPEENEPNTV